MASFWDRARSAAFEAGQLDIGTFNPIPMPDIARLTPCGARCFLVGESLLKHKDAEAAVARLGRYPTTTTPRAKA